MGYNLFEIALKNSGIKREYFKDNKPVMSVNENSKQEKNKKKKTENKKKNVLLLAMSILSPDKEKKINQNIYYCDETSHTYTGYGQLEPVPKMIVDQFGSVDKILVMATPDTLNQIYFVHEGKKKYQSAFIFFKNQMEKVGIKEIELVETDENQPNIAVSKVVNSLRTYKKQNKDINLYVDMHGGLRDFQLIIDAILSLLKVEGISPRNSYTVHFGKNKKIVNVNESTEIFDFVAGINEFLNFGSSKTLAQYIENNDPENTIIIKTIKNISEALSVCDIKQFDKALDEFYDATKKLKATINNKSFLGIFIDNMYEDYGDILDKKKRNIINELDWALKKDFIQQCLAIIESKTPAFLDQYVVKHIKITNITDPEKKLEITLEDYCKGEQAFRSENKVSTIYNSLAYAINNRNNKKNKDKKYKESVEYSKCSILVKHCAKKQDKYYEIEYSTKVEITENLKQAIELWALLKDVRNLVMHANGLMIDEKESSLKARLLNHFSKFKTKGKVVLEVEEIRQLVSKYIENQRAVIKKSKSLPEFEATEKRKPLLEFEARIIKVSGSRKNTWIQVNGNKNVLKPIADETVDGFIRANLINAPYNYQIGDSIRVGLVENNKQPVFVLI